MKKIVSMFLAMCMVMTIGAAFAAFAFDASVSVSGLMTGDTVRYYQVLEWDQANGTWKLADGFTSLASNSNFDSEDVIADIVDGITQTQANEIAALAKDATAKYTDENITGNTSTYTLPTDSDSKTKTDAMGLYMAIITAGSPEWIYNPVFVGADFADENTTNTFSATGNYGEGSVAKKQNITVVKTTEDANSEIATAIDSKVGEDVTFHVKTKIPVYLGSYTNPSFVITDNISTGIALKTGKIKVKLGTQQYDEGVYDVTDTFKVVENGTKGYTITFDAKYLSSNTAPVDVEIDYLGEVTNAATFNVNQDENTVTVTYSNGPTNEKAALRDRTNHYTFSIGAQIFGQSNEKGKTYELIKVGVDANGKPVVAKTLVSEWETKPERHSLAGATFGLYTNAECSGDPIDTFTTGADGVITFKGLDATTYYIKEITAPDGFVKDENKVKVAITASYEKVTIGPSEDANGIKVAGYDFDVLKSYSVAVNNVNIYDSTNEIYGKTNNTITSTYTFDNDGGTLTNPDETTINDSEMINTRGVELPSTGGIGTTIFYILGGLLVVGAAVILIARRKAQD